MASILSVVAQLLIRDLVNLSDFAPPVWGVFLDGAPVLTPDTIVAVDYRQSWQISDYPVEQGAFESYDKVNSPFAVKVRMAAGGSEVDRQDFIDSLNAIGDTLELYDVVTPEQVYQSVNVDHFDYNRRAGNVGLITSDVWFTQIRVTAITQFSQTKTASGASPVNGGNVQTQPATPSQQVDISFMQ